MYNKLITTFCLFLLFSLSLNSQTIAAFSGTEISTSATVVNVTASGITRGPGISSTGGTTFKSGNWTTNKSLDTNDYIQWSVTAAPEFIIKISSFQINFGKGPDNGFTKFVTGGGPKKIKIRTSLDNFKKDIYSNTNVSNDGQSPTVTTSLISEPGGTITFRLYGYHASVGASGANGTLDIEGGLGTALGIANTGILLKGNVTYNGLLYSEGTWSPNPPSLSTADQNILILNGIYTAHQNIRVNNLKVHPGAGIIIAKTGTINVGGDLKTSDNVILQSASGSYSGLIVKGNVKGDITYERYTATNESLNKLKNFALISTPVLGATFKTFPTSNPLMNWKNVSFPLMTYNTFKGDYVAKSKTESFTPQPAIGFKAALSGNRYFSFTGTVETASVYKDIINFGPAFQQWNLIGNPYPSYLKLNDFLAINNAQFSPNASGIYIYDEHSSSSWSVRNLAYLTIHPNAKITPGQGFFVASKHGGGTISFTPEMRSPRTADDLITPKMASKNNVGYLQLNISNRALNYSTSVYFNEQSTKGIDQGYDATIYGGNAPEFSVYTQLVENTSALDLAVQSLPYSDLENDVSIPLGIKAPTSQLITITIEESILPDEIHIYLKDNLTNTLTLLNTSQYSFISNSYLNDVQRFSLILSKSALEKSTTEDQKLQIYPIQPSQLLVVNGLIKTETQLKIFDQLGQLISSSQLEENTYTNQINIAHLSKGVYMIQLENSFQIKFEKLIIK